jgi:hypothetical protein
LGAFKEMIISCRPPLQAPVERDTSHLWHAQVVSFNSSLLISASSEVFSENALLLMLGLQPLLDIDQRRVHHGHACAKPPVTFSEIRNPIATQVV